MGIRTDISWADASLNLWIGCTKVSPLCDHCYAERDNARYKWVNWGTGQPRHRTGTELRSHLRKWSRHPERVIGREWPGRKPRVFINSYSDFFDNEVPDGWRAEAWQDFRQCQNLDLILVTKRVGNVEKMLPPDWDRAHHGNTILLISAGNQEEWDRDGPKLKAVKSRYPWLRVGLSMEPLLGRVDLGEDIGWLSWVIVGGESGGAEARPMHPDWALSLRDQCAAASVPFHFKQWGAWLHRDRVNVMKDHGYFEGDAFHPVRNWGAVHDKLRSHVVMERVGDRAAGRELGGKVYDEFVTAS